MQRAFRPSLLAAVAGAAIALTGSALGAASKDSGFRPDLWASNLDRLIGLQAVQVAGSPSDVATAKATIYVGRGDVMSLPGASVGKAIGGGAASARLGPAFGNAVVTLPGRVVVANPAKYAANRCSPGTHAAVWLLVLQEPTGSSLAIPVYVDPAPQPTRSFASYQIQTCLPSPYIPESQGGAPMGAKVFRVAVSLSNFQRAVSNRWTAVLTPYVEGTGVPNLRGTVETQSVVSQAKIAKFKAKRVSKRTATGKKYYAKIRGVVKQNGKGTKAKVVLYAVGKTKPVAAKRSKKSGKFRFKKRIKKTTRFVVAARKAPGHQTPPQCVPDLAGLPCTSVSTSGFQTFKVTKKFRVP